ncbi:MAG: hypothetical protein NTV86_16050 [Planctomycetota bacterium]|nr:hypothetical protein [Planctomycetota bacterium]
MPRMVWAGRIVVVIGVVVALGSAALGQSAPAATGADPAAVERAAAVKAEQAKDWDAALLHYETIYDSTPTTPEQRVELRHKFEELRPKVKPNGDLAKASLYKARTYVFRKTEIGAVKHQYTDKQIEDIRNATRAWAREIVLASMGNIRVMSDVVVIDKPLTKMEGCPDPDNCVPHFTDLEPGDLDFVMGYALTGGLPTSCWAATWGVACKGAIYSGFNDGGDGRTGGDGEVQVHEWMHGLQTMIDEHQMYPRGLVVNPDSGIGNCGKNCWQPKEGKGSLYDWYRHMLCAHVTRKMWRGVTVLRGPDNVWFNALNLCPRYLVVGGFEAAGRANHGLDYAYVDEPTVKPVDRAKAGPYRWRKGQATGRDLNFGDLYTDTRDKVAYAAALVRSPVAQAAQIRVGSDDSCKVWLNGALIISEPAPRECGLDQNVADVQLRQGDNLVLLKVANGGGDWLTNFRVTGPKGAALPGVTYALPGETPAVK